MANVNGRRSGLRTNYVVLQRLSAAQGGGLFVALLALSTYFTLANSHFLTRSNLLVVLLQVSVLGIVAVPGAMLLVSGMIDLSVGSVAGLAAACMGIFDKVWGWPLALSIVGALAVGGLWGLMNGVLVAYLRFSPVIVTLGGYAGAAGLAQTITSDQTHYGFGSAFAVLGNGEVAGVPVPVVIFVVVFLVDLVVRITALGPLTFFRSAFNCYDTLAVVTSVAALLWEYFLGGNSFGIEAQLHHVSGLRFVARQLRVHRFVAGVSR